MLVSLSDLKFIDGHVWSSSNLNGSVIVNTDSRSVKSHETFIALKGEKFDAHKFIEDVAHKGALGIIFNIENKASILKIIEHYPDIQFIGVSNTEKFMQNLARAISIKFQQNGGIVIGVTGSNGKTTTKEMLAHVLTNIGVKTIKTQKNNNNHLGVPLTLFQIEKSTQVAVVEMGSNHPGEIKVVVDIANPNIGITTNIGHTHMEFFPTLDDVMKEESYIYEAMKNYKGNKKFFINTSDKFLAKLNKADWCQTFGEDESNNYQFKYENLRATVTKGGNEHVISNDNITGKHNFWNLCVAFTIVDQIFPNREKAIIDAAKTFKPTSNRSEWLEWNKTKIYLDAYNANPSSMKAAIDGFIEKIKLDGNNAKNSCVILGDMNELGANTEELHHEIGNYAASKNFGHIYFVGRFAEHYNVGAKNSGLTYANTEECKAAIKDILTKHPFVLIKGSRSLQLESLIDIT